MYQSFESELIQIIESDDWMFKVLKDVQSLKLNDCWIGAGFVRNKIWDVKHKKIRTKLNDIDVIYFDKSSLSKEFDSQLEKKLREIDTRLPWSVKNQARMHLKNQHKEYTDCCDAISFWAETATSIAVRLNDNDQIEYIAPHGLHDLFNLIVKPTPQFNLDTYNNRVRKKQWKEKWKNLQIKAS